MRPCSLAGLLLLASSLTASAQSACHSDALATAGRHVEAIRHTLHSAAVPIADPAVPASIAAQLVQLKSALADAADAAFACAPTSVSDASIKATLAEALNANRSNNVETSEEVAGKKDQGAYGSDLAVEVFQLFNRPKIFEVNFRFGIECGDDNLLLIFHAPSETSGAWRETLRWAAPSYNNIGDALGDFIMLTPLTGDYKHPTWRFLVAHGHPGCGTLPRHSTFSLDLLTPTADPATPTVSWHFEHAYTEGLFTPRLATTEDAIDFRLVPLPPEDVKKTTNPAGSKGRSSRPPSKPATPASPEIYRFHLDSTGQIVPGEPATNPAASTTP